MQRMIGYAAKTVVLLGALLGGAGPASPSSGNAIYTITDSNPHNAHTGNGATSVLIVGNATTSAAYSLGVCFYTGSSSAVITPDSFDGNGAAITVPASSFATTTATTATIYLQATGTTCTGASPGFSNSFSFPIVTTQDYTITAATPATIPAGSGDTQVVVTGAAQTADQLNYGICFYTGSNSSPIIPTAFTQTNATFTVPAANFAIDQGLFTNGTYNASIYLNPLDKPCNGVSIGASNTFNVQVVYPTLTSVSLQALAQPNPNLNYVSYPNRLELFGSNLSSTNLSTQNTGPAVDGGFFFNDASGKPVNNDFPGAKAFPATGAVVVSVPALAEAGATTVATTVCNAVAAFPAPYCSNAINLQSYPLAGETTALTTTNPSPAIGQAVTFTATVTPGLGSTTAGGTYLPGAPSGNVGFLDGGAVLGSAPLKAATLTFTSTGSRALQTTTQGNQGYTPYFADFNQDGLQDTLLLDSAGALHLFLGGSPAGTLQAEHLIAGPSSCIAGVLGLAVGDLNGDGYPDIAYLCNNSDAGISVQILSNQGDGTFAQPVQVASNANLAGTQLGIGDVNKDGKADLIVTGIPVAAGAATYRIQTLLGDGAGTFSVGPATATGAAGTQLNVQDLNHDGAVDLAVLTTNGAGTNTSIQVYANDGTGAFTALVPITACNCATTSATVTLAVAPVAGNPAYPDLVAALSGGSTPAIVVALNKQTAALAFAAPTTQAVAGQAQALIGDFNGDGLPDLATYDGQYVKVLNGDGTGAFAASAGSQSIPVTVGDVNPIQLIGAADLNNDGYADLLTRTENGTGSVLSYLTSGNAVATLTVPFTSSGAHTITTHYNGTPTLLGGTGGSVTENVASATKATPAVTFTVSPAPHVYTPNLATTFTITVAGTSSLPTGTVQFYVNGAPDGAPAGLITDSSTQVHSYITFASLPAGTFRVAAVYSGDSAYNTVTTNTITYTVSQATPTITWNPSPATIVYGTPLTLGQQLNATADVPGAFSYNPGETSILDAGTQTLSSTFTPSSANYQAVTRTATITVTQQTPTITWPASTISYGTSLSATQLNAVAKDAAGNTLPGALTYNPSFGAILPVGTTAATVRFAPTNSRDFVAVNGTTNITVTAASTTTALSIAPNPITLGQTTTLTATVSTPLNNIVTGLVVFNDGDAVIGRGTLSGNTATFAYTPTSTGPHAIQASYQGTTNYASSLATGTLTVNSANLGVSWTPNPATIVYGTALGAGQLDATVTGLTSGLTASAPTYTPAAGTVLGAGTQVLKVSFGILQNSVLIQTITGQTTITVTPQPTVTLVKASPNPVALGQPTTLTATVTPVPTSGAEIVTLFVDNVQISQGPFNGTGSYTLQYTPTTVGNHTVTATYAGDANDAASTGQTQLVVNTPALSVAWTPTLATIPYGTPLGASQLNATVTGLPTGLTASAPTYTPAAGTVLHAGTQILKVSFNILQNSAVLQTLTGQTTITVSQVAPIITWSPVPITVGTALGDNQRNAVARDAAGNTIAGLFTYTPGLGTVLPAGTQTLSATFAPTDAVDYTAAAATALLTVSKLAVLGALTSNPTQAYTGQAVLFTLTLTPAATSTIPVTGSVTFLDNNLPLGTATVTNGIATLSTTTLAAGTHPISTIYMGDANYLQSNARGLNETILSRVPTLTWSPSPATIVYGTPLVLGQELDAVAVDSLGNKINGTFAYTPAPGAILQAGRQTLNVTFTPDAATAFQAASAQSSVLVSQATPTITWNPAPLTQGAPLGAAQLNAMAADASGKKIPGAFTYLPAAGATLPIGAQTLTATFIPDDALDYATTTATALVSVVSSLTGTVIGSTPNPAVYGQGIVFTATVSRTGSATTAPTGIVTFTDGTTNLGMATLANGVATLPVASLNAGNHTILGRYSGDSNNAGNLSAGYLQVVTQTVPQFTWTPSPAAIVYGTPLSPANTGELDAVAKTSAGVTIPGTFTYTPAAGSVLKAGTQTLSATFTPTDAVNVAAGTATTLLTVTRAVPVIVWPTPGPINQGTALDATQLDATIGKDANGNAPRGTFTYSPAPGTTLPAGTQTLSVTFVPSDAVDFTTANATVPLVVQNIATATALTSSVNPTQFRQPTVLTAAIARQATSTTALTGTVTFFDGATQLGQPVTVTATSTGASATTTVTTLAAGLHQLKAVYSGDTNNTGGTSLLLQQKVTQAPVVLTWNPTVAAFPYGTLLGASQLNATATSAYAGTVPGTPTYTPAAGSLLNAGPQTLTLQFTPTDATDFLPATQTAAITVTRATPVLTFPTPPAAVAGTPLSSLPLTATAIGVAGTSLPGKFAFTSSAGSTVIGGPQVITVLFTPADTLNYTTATATATLNGATLTLASLSSTTAFLGDGDKTITLTGTGFAPDAVARVNGTPIATKYVSSTTLTAIIPATDFLAVQTLQITVADPTETQTSAALPFTVSPPSVSATLTAPTTANSGEQPAVRFALATPYPVPVTATLTLTFTPAAGGIVDPAVQFAGGGKVLPLTIPAGATAVPAIQLQSGTVAGTIQITLVLTAGGVNVTPASVAPVTITVPPVVPILTSTTLVRSGRTLTVNVIGFSNTREITRAAFHFTPAAGKQIQTQDVTVDATTLFSGWYTQTASDTYGSAFLYTQTFTLDDDATVVGQVTVTLTNGIGVSIAGTAE